MKFVLSVFVLIIIYFPSIVFTNSTTYLAYTIPGTYMFTVPNEISLISLLVVAGGGGAGAACRVNAATPYTTAGGGGGAGGMLCNSNVTVIPGTTLTVIVGKGGKAAGVDACSGSTQLAENGGTSQFDNYIATGGGGGQSNCNVQTVNDGGSGGGASCWCAGGLGIPGQGYNGGTAGRNGNTFAASGGGGAGGNGGDSGQSGAGLTCPAATGNDTIFAIGGSADGSIPTSDNLGPGSGGSGSPNCGCNQIGLDGRSGIVAISWLNPIPTTTASSSATSSASPSESAISTITSTTTSTGSVIASFSSTITSTMSSTMSSTASSSINRIISVIVSNVPVISSTPSTSSIILSVTSTPSKSRFASITKSIQPSKSSSNHITVTPTSTFNISININSSVSTSVADIIQSNADQLSSSSITGYIVGIVISTVLLSISIGWFIYSRFVVIKNINTLYAGTKTSTANYSLPTLHAVSTNNPMHNTKRTKVRNILPNYTNMNPELKTSNIHTNDSAVNSNTNNTPYSWKLLFIDIGVLLLIIIGLILGLMLT